MRTSAFSRTLILVLLAPLAGTAFAGEKKSARAVASTNHKEVSVARCLGAGDTSKIFSCLEGAYNLQDKKLNDTYAELMALLKTKASARHELALKAQRAWIRLRDSDCQYEASADEAGEASGAASLICQIAETDRRQAVLEHKLTELKERLAQTGE